MTGYRALHLAEAVFRFGRNFVRACFVQNERDRLELVMLRYKGLLPSLSLQFSKFLYNFVTFRMLLVGNIL